MSQVFIPGYLASVELTLAAVPVDLTVIGNVLSLDLSKNALPKPVFGQQWRNTASGQLSGALSLGGHLSVEHAGTLLDLIVSEEPIPFVIYAGEEGGTIDAGSYEGNCVVSGISISDDAEGEWEWTLDADTDGPVTFTPAVAP